MHTSSQIFYFKKLGPEDPQFVEGKPMNEVKIAVTQRDGITTNITGTQDKNNNSDNTEVNMALALALQNFVGKDRVEIDAELKRRGFKQTI